MHRFFFSQSLSIPEIVIVDSKEIHHLKNVLRLKLFAKIDVFNGQGQEAKCTIQSMTSNAIHLHIDSLKTSEIKLPTIILACAMPKKSKFELIIEKATELGVAEIIPLKTKRTEIILNGERALKKINRYQTVAINASKQSKRITVPIIHPITELKTALLSLSQRADLIIPSLELKRQNIFDALKRFQSPQSVACFIGPEGDFTPEEYKLAQKHGCLAVSLGKTILKVETAAISATACLNIHYHS